ncbi:putative pumilio homolog 8, chloroplastic [Cyclospora cayetanensis]|uniref:Pumilio homolog 8, chloroplastic n=1 Tax=Cyclospora cayetanensis TaxID=88456 RepID=A0A6P6RYL4_9EIME|nr:putative pumilio homolog 8, chloroplastic [Cyclospora cayetanensis]
MGGAAAREVRGGVVTAPELPLLSGNTRARVAANENNAERVASRGGGGRAKASGGSATPMSSSSAANGVALNARGDEQVSSSPRLSEIDILQADDESLFRTAKDQGGCRLLQRLLADGTPDEVDRVFNMAFSRLEELMTDAYGNYLFQKLLDVCSDDQLRQLLHAITPHLKDICLDPHGTRTAQKLIEVICGSRQSPSLTQELICAFEPLVVDLATDANGNHVIKRFLWCSTRESSACSIDFILKTACDHCVHIATERHGCCVMQRCCEAATGVLKVCGKWGEGGGMSDVECMLKQQFLRGNGRWGGANLGALLARIGLPPLEKVLPYAECIANTLLCVCTGPDSGRGCS